MDRLEITQEYDEDADVLYISFGTPKKAIVVEVGEGNLVRYDKEMNRIVGITIEDFERYDDEFIEELTKAFNEKPARILKWKGDVIMAKDKGKPKPGTKTQPKPKE